MVESETSSLGTGDALVQGDNPYDQELESINCEALNAEIHCLTTDLQSGTKINPVDIIKVVTLQMDKSLSRDEKIEQLRRNFDNFSELSDRESFKCDVCLILNQVSKAVKGLKTLTDRISETFHKTQCAENQTERGQRYLHILQLFCNRKEHFLQLHKWTT